MAFRPSRLSGLWAVEEGLSSLRWARCGGREGPRRPNGPKAPRGRGQGAAEARGKGRRTRDAGPHPNGETGRGAEGTVPGRVIANTMELINRQLRRCRPSQTTELPSIRCSSHKVRRLCCASDALGLQDNQTWRGGDCSDRRRPFLREDNLRGVVTRNSVRPIRGPVAQLAVVVEPPAVHSAGRENGAIAVAAIAG
jgi:hypothetical protein